MLSWIATAGPVGRIPFAPGTFGTLVAIPFVLALREMSFAAAAFAVFGFLVLGWTSTNEKIKTSKVPDPPEIVVDEIVGFIVATWLLPYGWRTLVIAFVAFRFYDILKPFPAGYFDRNIHSGTGIVMDDVVSGVYANLTVRALLWSKTLLF